jgi:cytoskeletal protein CcmA (bactofilin family)
MEKTIISADLKITGNLSGKAEIDVAGSIDGDVEGKSIDILTSGSVSGAVKVTTANIRGRLAGSLEAETVVLHPGADVKADISARELEIQKGAKI